MMWTMSVPAVRDIQPNSVFKPLSERESA